MADTNPTDAQAKADADEKAAADLKAFADAEEAKAKADATAAAAPDESPLGYDSLGQAFRDGVLVPSASKLRP